jgi:23S rRNA (uracil1939-C5)-methyltransferase
MTDDFRLVYGDSVLKDNIGSAEFNISPQSFYQVNPLQTERLYEKAFEYAALKDGEALVDLFCGIGTIGIYFAKRATEQGIKLRSLLGIEYTERAVKDAAVNAELNGVSDISNFLAGDAEKVLGKIAEEVEKSKPDVMVVDPPRKGLTENLIKSVAFCKPSRVVYVSCNPATLARDLKVFAAEGYRTEKVCAVDMFPGSGHCETVVLLSRQIIVHKMKK